MPEKKNVLVICRTAAGQMYLGVLLNRIWYTPVLARTAEDGIRLAQNKLFSMILFDGDLPENELLTALSLLRADPSVKHLPLIVFITGERSSITESLLSMGCSAVLTKPLDLAIVYGVLARISGQPRNTPRVPVKFRVEIEEGMPEKSLTCINISEGGMYLRTHRPLPEKSMVRLKLMLPHSSEKLEITGEVVRTALLGAEFASEPGMGLRFVDIPENVQQQIRNFVQWEMTGDLEWEANI